MRMHPDPERDDALLQVMLQDETWQSSSAAFKAQALSKFRGRHRVRRLARWAGGMAVLGAVILGVAYLTPNPAPPPQQVAVVQPPAPAPARQAAALTDEQLVASFPKGSCFIAEVDGKKELVFLDPALQHTYVARSGAAGN